MTKSEIIELIATGDDHARLLRGFKKAQLESFLEAQTDPTDNRAVKPGQYIFDGTSNRNLIVTASETIPGRSDNVARFVAVPSAASGARLHDSTSRPSITIFS